MKIGKRILLFFTFLLFFSLGVYFTDIAYSSTPTPVVEYTLPYPGILPNHPLYFFKKIRDKIVIFFTKDLVKRSNLYLLLADKNLVMGQMLWDQQDYGLSTTTFQTAENYLLLAIKDAKQAKESGILPEGRLERISLAVKKHEEVITNIILHATNKTRSQELDNLLKITQEAKKQVDVLK